MKRSGWETGALVMQLLLGIVLTGICVFLLWLIRFPETVQPEDAGAVSAGLKVAAGILAPPAVIVLIGAYGLWRTKLWGWWLALLTDLTLLGVFIYSAIDDGLNTIDWDIATLTLIPFLALSLLLTRPVRDRYWGAVSSEFSGPPTERPT